MEPHNIAIRDREFIVEGHRFRGRGEPLEKAICIDEDEDSSVIDLPLSAKLAVRDGLRELMQNGRLSFESNSTDLGGMPMK